MSVKKVDVKPSTALPSKKPVDPVLESRETVESFAVAIILALLFRAFIAEAFVIPTGSMAPTLMGRHVDTTCRECGYAYQASASSERNSDDSRTGSKIVNTRCPNCAHRQALDIKSFFSNEHSFSGDRIIVSKYAYEFSDPQRWDVIVFKHTQDQDRGVNNYIKRLIGLPGETVRIEGGNIYTRREREQSFRIARKPTKTLLAMLQIVHDADHVAPQLAGCNWPSRWQAVGSTDPWKIAPQGQSLQLTAADDEAWARYHHFEPLEEHWKELADGNGKSVTHDITQSNWQGQLIADFYAYNSGQQIFLKHPEQAPMFGRGEDPWGKHWVDDLALEVTADVKSAAGQLALDLVRGGTHYVCRINVATGKAVLTIEAADGSRGEFGEGTEKFATATADTSLQGPGTYQLRLTNVDHEMRLWVNDSPVAFDKAAIYDSPALVLPDVADTARGDLAPAGVGGSKIEVNFAHLKLWRDKYYITHVGRPDYDLRSLDRTGPRHVLSGDIDVIRDVLAFPDSKSVAWLMKARQFREFEMGADHFMPLGDNSPASADARDSGRDGGWERPYVERHLLIGRASCIYWPHSWWSPLCWPNFRRMQPIH